MVKILQMAVTAALPLAVLQVGAAARVDTLSFLEKHVGAAQVAVAVVHLFATTGARNVIPQGHHGAVAAFVRLGIVSKTIATAHGVRVPAVQVTLTADVPVTAVGGRTSIAAEVYHLGVDTLLCVEVIGSFVTTFHGSACYVIDRAVTASLFIQVEGLKKRSVRKDGGSNSPHRYLYERLTFVAANKIVIKKRGGKLHLVSL